MRLRTKLITSFLTIAVLLSSFSFVAAFPDEGRAVTSDLHVSARNQWRVHRGADRVLHVRHGREIAGWRELDVRVEHASGGAAQRLLDAVRVPGARELLDDDGIGAESDDEGSGVRGGREGSGAFARRDLCGRSLARGVRAARENSDRANQEGGELKARHV